ncbi:MFS transporter [Allokutzneria sp. NRRL B-24872]|uniref:MFS transporter n=1 Tax=Allokutzneria sp. NRRL B-24872 TaxID=1137961 RepID=UPI001FEDCCF0|nr:MFS transporter [Allokutzneria sp. NRRL B-24872]
MIALVLMLCAFSIGTSEFVIVGVLPEVAADLSVTLPVAGMLVTAYAVAVALGGPVLTVLTARLPRRPLLVSVMVLGTVAAVLSAIAADYTLLMGARMLGALAHGLFFSVASQVAVASVPPERRTAAVAKVVNGIALSTVVGVPLGTLVGQAYGWRASFVLVTALTVIGLIGVLVACPRVEHEQEPGVRESLFAFARPAILLGLLTTVLSFAGMITAFTYVAPTLREITGLSPGWVTAVLLVYGLGTIVGSNLAGRVPPDAIPRVLPIPIAVLTALLVAQGFLMHNTVTAVLALFVLGASAFTTGPLLHTWLMGEAGRASGLVASVNISAFNVAAAFGPVLGGAVISGGLGLALVPALAAAPALAGTATALLIRSRARSTPRARHRAPAAIGSPGSP